jgi:SWI/SNF-related matrix-associated actin-dependent regulator of chromatin subfamily A3
LLQLLDNNYKNRFLKFSIAERIQYFATEREIVKAVKEHDNQARNTKDYFKIFQLQLQLRRLCNHRTFQKLYSRLSVEEMQFDLKEALALLQQKNDAKCIYCNAEVTRLNDIEEEQSGYFTVCSHLLCSVCVPRYEQALRKGSKRSSVQCSLCLCRVPTAYLLTSNIIAKQSSRKVSPTGEYFETSGVSSKVSALVADIERRDTVGKWYVGL